LLFINQQQSDNKYLDSLHNGKKTNKSMEEGKTKITRKVYFKEATKHSATSPLNSIIATTM